MCPSESEHVTLHIIHTSLYILSQPITSRCTINSTSKYLAVQPPSKHASFAAKKNRIYISPRENDIKWSELKHSAIQFRALSRQKIAMQRATPWTPLAVSWRTEENVDRPGQNKIIGNARLIHESDFIGGNLFALRIELCPAVLEYRAGGKGCSVHTVKG